ncbi:MAG: hypothetical protein WC823_04705 [Parcubacteria group bacterium]|jgi:hypothetical protein
MIAVAKRSINWLFWIFFMFMGVMLEDCDSDYANDCCLFVLLGILILFMSCFMGTYLKTELVIGSFALNSGFMIILAGVAAYLALGIIVHRSLRSKWNRDVI